ncbi:hypothetical protein BAUCODRAFT_61838 [Baudoinia panamericana UAMH 10762]|uniref:Dynactin subunit 4 n=1 Tax=Baudoinia panamericana (strain UAMH 10762) TaxID=717646 RepID=M2NNM4_BAUPA|nr:uncharacterized protein BAUCODRAFT_61838 [Baudoinia panamericana UAMH 10762]EMD01115.1 hypothetical protein BAUCODRAFT_61838 [Baudoinia panamericana UAMH 10762]
MAAAPPYALYVCPCSSLSSTTLAVHAKRASAAPADAQADEDSTFNSHDPRANYALYPLDHLLFCNECDCIRCPRCYTEEILNWYCPSCMFEVPSSQVKNDGNRCARNCYDCPICTSALTVAALPRPSETHLNPNETEQGRYILQCGYCEWSSLDQTIEFSKPTKITEQLAKKRKEQRRRKPEDKAVSTAHGADQVDGYENLMAFYKEQLAESGDASNTYSSSPYSSPANLAKIMSLYGGLSVNALKKAREKPQPMREARTDKEGLQVHSLDSSAVDEETVRRLQAVDWQDTPTHEQRFSGPLNHQAIQTNELWPVATPLRIRKGKRCSVCRQFLSRPEPKIPNLRYKIRLLASNYVPRLLLRPLNASSTTPNPAFRLRPNEAEMSPLQPNIMQQYLLTVRNPIFETVKITLATSSSTPGKVSSRVTILCPSFTVGPAGDVWDEALSSSTTSVATDDGGRQAAMASLTGKSTDEADRQPEAGKIWTRSRNSTSIILEVVPGALKPPPSIVPKSDDEMLAEELTEDKDVLEIPIFVRAQWDAVEDTDASASAGRKHERRAAEGEKVRKELAYWCVIGVGHIADG